MADKFLHELDPRETLSNEDLLLISKKDSEGNYTTEYASVADLSSHISNLVSGEIGISDLSDNLSNHINETNVEAKDKKHITSDERSTWNDAADFVTKFKSTEVEGVIDTLKEIQDWFANEDNKNAAGILEAIAGLQAENAILKKKLAAYDTRFGFTSDDNIENVSWTVNFLKINSPAKS